MRNVASRSAAAEPSSPLRSFRDSRQGIAPAESKSTEWVDGSQPEPNSYSDGDGDDAEFRGRKLSKADRKRLRKQKRAA